MNIKNLLKFSILFFLVIGLSVSNPLLAATKQDCKDRKVPMFFLGKKSAPVVMYSYMAFGCPHCKDDFAMIMQKVYPKYIQAGKVKMVFRGISITGQKGVQALNLAYRSTSNEQFFKIAQMLFDNQYNWYNSSDSKQVFIKYGQIANMSQKSIQDYKSDNKLPKKITCDIKYILNKTKVTGTPTTFIVKNGHAVTTSNSKYSIRIDGAVSYEVLKSKIDQMLQTK